MPDKKLTEGTTPIDYEGTLKSLTESYYNALDSINRLQAQNDKLYETIDYRADKITELEDKLKTAKAEIERLEKDSKRLKKVEMQLDDAMKMYDTIKAEAYKEFAERLKDKHRKIIDYDEAGFGAQIFIVEEKVIDNLLNELVGDKE